MNGRDGITNSCEDHVKKSELVNRLKTRVMEYEGYSEGSFEHRINKGYSTIWLFQSAVMRIRETRQEMKIEIKTEYLKLFDLENEATFRKSDLNWGKIPGNFHIIAKIVDNIEVVFEQCYLDGPVEIFGCCSRYVQCSDNKGCVHPDKRVARGCMYKSNLDKGRIFYGTNRNVD